MARDRYDDEGYDDRDDDRPRRRGGGAAAAKSAVLGPAIGLLVVAGLVLVGSLINVVQMATGGFAQQMDQQKEAQLKQIDDSAAPAAQKQQQKDMMIAIYDGIKAYGLIAVGLTAVGSLVILFGAIQMMRLRSRGLAMTASILAMIPFFTSCCCVAGIPIGIWAIITLGKPEVKAAFATPTAPPAFDDLDDRG